MKKAEKNAEKNANVLQKRMQRRFASSNSQSSGGRSRRNYLGRIGEIPKGSPRDHVP